ncbi:MAG: hypothetical protein CMM25_00770 [Rhodospirillaceae bacterium]|nr:hypothetical protein [Rhodospirillaceae bacterium]
MIRVVLTFLVPLFFAIILYFLWVRLANKVVTNSSLSTPSFFWSNKYVFLLLFCILFAATSFTLALINGDSTDSIYVPPSYEGGKIIPGFFKER